MKWKVTNHQGAAGSFYQYIIFFVAEIVNELSAMITAGILLIILGLNWLMLGQNAIKLGVF